MEETMNETVQIILGFVILLAVMILSKRFRAGRMFKARDRILADLRRQGATVPEQAVSLPYSSRTFHFGLRDDRPRILREMIQFGIVGVTEEQKFYLNEEVLQSGVVQQGEQQARITNIL